MTPNPAIMNAVEKLGYRVTVGDVAAAAGLEINTAEQGLLALASEAQGHMQVAESGDIVYLFPKNFRFILTNKYWQLRLQQWIGKIWKVLFYLIRISFGIILILSILLMLIAIAVILFALSSSRDGDGDSGGGDGNVIFYPHFWISPDIFWFFNYDREAPRSHNNDKQMNFLESVFSFLFGDGNPNHDLENHRWQEIGSVILNNNGAVVAQQISPYLDKVDSTTSNLEDYMLPVLTRFNGYPEVSPNGGIVYYFPSLQVSASQKQYQPVAPFLKEKLWQFSKAGSGQIMLSIGLGAVNFILALVLGSLLRDGVVDQIGGIVTFANSIYWGLLGYSVSYLGIPFIRYFWIQGKNKNIDSRNFSRQQRAMQLNQADPELQEKIDYARQFAAQKVITDADITYTTETDLLEQDLKRADKIDEEWRRRLESGS